MRKIYVRLSRKIRTCIGGVLICRHYVPLDTVGTWHYVPLTTAYLAVVLNKTVYQVPKVGNLEINVLSYVLIVSLLLHCIFFSVIRSSLSHGLFPQNLAFHYS